VSRKKYTKTEINLIVSRVVASFGFKKERELADFFEESPQSFSNKKNTGTIINLIEKEAYKQNLNVHYLLTGENTPTIAEPIAPYFINDSSLNKRINEILASGSPYADLLKSEAMKLHADMKQDLKMKKLLAKLEEKTKRKSNCA